jgi:hypothetical protein
MRPAEELYAYGSEAHFCATSSVEILIACIVNQNRRIVPAASPPNLPWKGYLQKPKPVKPAELRNPKGSKRKRNVADIGGRREVEREEVAVGFMGLAKMFRGMLTPAASLLNMRNPDRQL